MLTSLLEVSISNQSNKITNPMCATYADKQKRLHFESFANKIFTGIREINPEYAEKRAIWELFQNALDTIDGNGKIEIVRTERGMKFKHNGRPFSDDEFGGLIKQFSVGKTYGDNNEKVGQYGTGFISTHIYGKRIIVNGSVKTDDGSFRVLQDFEIDRDAEGPEQLTDKLLEQDQILDLLCQDAKSSSATPQPFTTFEYLTSQNQGGHLDAMLAYIKEILPYIFCFNDKLTEVRLATGTIVETYHREGVAAGEIQLMRNDKPISIPILQNEDGSVRVIMGSANIKLDGIPKLFLYYPLMETADAGTNFIIHAKDFKPNKERDYLYMAPGNPEIKTDVKVNESLLSIGFKLAIEKIVADGSLPMLEVSKLKFTSEDSAFETELKSGYITKIKDLQRIKIDAETYSLSSFNYFDKSVLLLELESIQAAYAVLKQFRKLPPAEEFTQLSERVNNWNDVIAVKFPVLTIYDIGKIVASEGGGNYYYMGDKHAFRRVISEIAKDSGLLNESALTPNIHGDFKPIESLVKWEEADPELVTVIDFIAADISKKYIHDDFRYLEGIAPYNREKFKDDFSNLCNDFKDGIEKGNTMLLPNGTRFHMLIQTLKDFVSLNRKTTLNIEVASFFERKYELKSQYVVVTDPSKDVNYQPAIKLLANLHILWLKDKNIAYELDDLNKMITIMFRNTNLKEDLLHKLPCIPNQNYILKAQNDVKKDEVLDERFKDKYDEIIGGNSRNDMAHQNFSGFLQHPGTITGEQLGDEIERFLNQDKKFIPVNNTTLNVVLNLIEMIADEHGKWGKWLPNIDMVKEEILMHKFQDGKTRSSLFSILTKNVTTIALLGELAEVEDLEDLISKGRQKQQEVERRNKHLIYISYIGLTIQNLIEKQLGVELAGLISVMKSEDDSELKTKEEQNGQDFIIYKRGKPVYYLEVKSKWDENGRFALSKNQTEKCAKQKGEYAVISVNVDRYKKKHAVTTEDILFEDLKEFVKVNDDLGGYFEKLVLENISKSEDSDPKLIEYRGSIPQKMIDVQGSAFDPFISKLIERLIAI
jgi:hypothetical protein